MSKPTKLESRLRQLIQDSGIPEVGVGFHNFRGGNEFLIDGDRAFHAASMMKVPVMCEAFHQMAEGRLSLETTLPIANQFVSIEDGSVYSVLPEDDANQSLYERIGGGATVGELVEIMVTESGNLATNILVERLGVDRIASYMRQLGTSGMVVLRGVCDEKAFAKGLNSTGTARGYLDLTVALAEGRVVTREASDQMIQILLRQRHNEGTPAGLPPGTRVAHKTGWNTDFYHDGGLIFDRDGPAFALAVFTKGASTMERAHELVAALAHECWNSVSDANPSPQP